MVSTETVGNDKRDANTFLFCLLTKPLYIVLLPLVAPVMIFAANIHRLTPGHGILAAAWVLGGYLILNGIVYLIVRRKDVGNLIVAFTFIVMVLLPLFIRGSLPMLLSFSISGWFTAVFLICRYNETRKIFTIFLNAVTFTTLFQFSIGIVNSPVWAKRQAILNITDGAFDPVENMAVSREQHRDIYYLILDRYARDDVLRNVYAYNNSDFLDELKRRGFSVAGDSHANYQRTAHSLISSLNFDYLNDIHHEESKNSPDWVPLYRMLADTRIIRFLKRQGYGIHHFGSWWEPTRVNANADFSHNWYALPEAIRAIYEDSLVLPLARLVGIHALDPRWMQYRRSRLMFETIPKIEHKAPIFVFAHFLVPHPPFVTHETGRFMEIDEARSISRRDNYIGQLRYANREILKLIDTLQDSRPKPIIILQSDEGPWPLTYAGDEITKLGRDVSSVDWRAVSQKELKEKLGILSALYLPDETISVPNDTSPVNFFRIILSNYFGVALENLPDLHFVFENNRNLYEFIEISSILGTNHNVERYLIADQ